VPIAAAQDDLADMFPMWRPQGNILPEPGSQGGKLLSRLSRRREALARCGVTAGRARIAYAASGCRACGMCLYGCPYGVIFNAAHEVKKLCSHARFSYEPGMRAVRFEEDDSSVSVVVAEANGQLQRRIAGDRLFIGAGVLSTARIVLNSAPQRLSRLSLRDSQHALMPMLHAWAPPAGLETAPRNAFAQAFLEIEDERLSATTIHAQIYAYNDLYRSDLQLRFGYLAPAFGPLIDVLSRRLLVAQIFAHSDHGGTIGLSLDGGPGDSRLAYSVTADRAAERVLHRSANVISSALFPAGVIALRPQLRLGAIGSSFHVGASLPMSDRPKCDESDTLGRIAGLRRVHVIDASVFPSVPATTITFTVMANAHRIATDAPL
jgi:choline dehydrogenase-like flavoprotein